MSSIDILANSEPSAEERDWAETTDIFGGIGGEDLTRANNLPRLTDEQVESIRANSLFNDAHGRQVSSELADVVFSMLKRNEFQPIVADMGSLETPPPCSGSDKFYSWEEYQEMVNHDAYCLEQVERGEEDPDPERRGKGWWNLDYSNQCRNENLDLADDNQHEAAVTRLQALSDLADSQIMCAECPIRMQCLSASITKRSVGGGLDMDYYGVYGGYDADSRMRIFSKVQDAERKRNKELRRSGIIATENGHQGFSDDHWNMIVSDPEAEVEAEPTEAELIDADTDLADIA